MAIISREFVNSKISMAILVADLEDLKELAYILKLICRNEILCEGYKDIMSGYMLEVQMPYTMFNKVTKRLEQNGYVLKKESEVGILYRLCKR